MTPDEVLKNLLAGNERYQKSTHITHEVLENRAETAKGQSPDAFILSCIDSRVVVEQVFDQEMGSMFVGRVAGSVVSEDQLGSMEFATKVVGAKVILVMGHTKCGAVAGACDEVELGNLTSLLGKIKPAVTSVKSQQPELAGEDLHLEVTKQSVKDSIATILASSSIIKELVDSGEVKIAGAIYDITTGGVSLV